MDHGYKIACSEERTDEIADEDASVPRLLDQR
jgi:hypothetical protein